MRVEQSLRSTELSRGLQNEFMEEILQATAISSNHQKLGGNRRMVRSGLPGNGRQIKVLPKPHMRGETITTIDHPIAKSSLNRVAHISPPILLKRLGPDHPHHLSSVDETLSFSLACDIIEPENSACVRFKGKHTSPRAANL